MAIDAGMFERQLARAFLDLEGGPVRVRLVCNSPSMIAILLVPAPEPETGYVPRAGDVWVTAVLRPAGVQVVASAGWSAAGEVPGVVDEQTGRVGALAVWRRVLPDDRPDPFAVTLDAPVWARGVLRAYRDGGPGVGCLVGSSTAEMEGDGGWS